MIPQYMGMESLNIPQYMGMESLYYSTVYGHVKDW